MYYNPISEIYHLESKTPGRGRHIMFNRSLFVERWSESINADDRQYLQEDGFEAQDYVKPGSEPDGEMASYVPVLKEMHSIASPEQAEAPAILSGQRVLNIGFCSIWHARGISFHTQQLALSLEGERFKTHIFARWESDRFQNSGPIYHPRVHNAGDDPSERHIIAWALERELDLVIFMEVHPNDWKRVEALKSAGIRVMCYENLDILRLEFWDRYKIFDYFLFNAFYARDIMLSKFPNAVSLTVPWGVKPRQVIRTARKKASDRVRFTHVAGWGGINSRKNTDLLIRVFDDAKDANASLDIYSQAPLATFGADCLEIVRRNHSIRVHEGTADDIFEAYQNGDVLLWPSKREGLGLPIVEALSVGLPVVVSDGYMMKQWIVPGEHGVLCHGEPIPGKMVLPEIDVDRRHLTQLIGTLASNADEIQRMTGLVEKDRDIWSWDWQASVLQEQLARMIEFSGYSPPADLRYLPENVLAFEERRQKSYSLHEDGGERLRGEPVVTNVGNGKHVCNLCGSTSFVAMNNRPNARCGSCGSSERIRLLHLYLEKLGIPQTGMKVLHFAPERGLYNVISKVVNTADYMTADIDPHRFPFAKNIVKFDMCTDMESLPDNHFDLIIHSHVLEHIKCNVANVLFHLHRALKIDGWHICVIPFSSGTYNEDLNDISHEEATRRFGQFDHVRRFGRDDINESLGQILNFDTQFDATKDFPVQILRKYNIPERSWRGLSPATVLILRKSDIKMVNSVSDGRSSIYAPVMGATPQRVNAVNFVPVYGSGNSSREPRITERAVVLHVGLHKTGTTSIQNTMSKNNKLLKRQGYLYPRCWPANHSIPIYSSFCVEPEKYHINIRRGYTKETIQEINTRYLDSLYEEVANTHFRILLISGEDISQLPSDSLIKLREYMRSVLPGTIKFRVIFYVRNPATWVPSRIQEGIKNGQGTLEQVNLMGLAKNLFRSRIEKFSLVFGPKAVEVYSFEEAVAHERGIVGHFLSMVGVSSQDVASFKIDYGNPSISQPAAQILSYINARSPMIEAGMLHKDRAPGDSAPLMRMRGPKFDIPYFDKQVIIESNREDIEWLKENYGIDYSALKPEDTPGHNTSFPDEALMDLGSAYRQLSHPLKELVKRYLQEEADASNDPRLLELLKDLR
jgi:phosphoglycolate phosphatase